MPSLEDNTTQVGSYTDKRHIIPVNSQGFFQTPQDIMEEYNGCSVPPVHCLLIGEILTEGRWMGVWHC